MESLWTPLVAAKPHQFYQNLTLSKKTSGSKQYYHSITKPIKISMKIPIQNYHKKRYKWFFERKMFLNTYVYKLIEMFKLTAFFLLLALVASVSFQSLYDRELKSSYGFQILKHYHSEPFGNEDVKKFKGQSMLFLAPWRTSGIELAIKYMKKFDYFVPCYYDLKKKHFSKENQTVELDISKYYSQEYLDRAKAANPDIQIVPRIYVDGMQGDVFLLASTKEEQMNKTLGFFEDIFANPYYSGIFFQSPFITPNHQYPFSMKNFLKSLREIADSHGKKLMIGLDGVDPKPDQKINKKKARELMALVDKVVIANYDCPRGNDGINIPISPMDWVKQNYDFYCEVYSKAKLTPKLIMAIPLYGYFVAMYGKYDPIEGKDMLQKLKKEKQAWLSWNQQLEECMIYLNKMEYLYFPCLHFLNNRLRYFQSINAGVGAFEIGSGLEIFMQMF